MAQPAQNTPHIPIFEDPGVPDPASARDFADRQLLSAMCGKQLELTPDGRFTGDVAERFEWTAGKRGLGLHPRAGAVELMERTAPTGLPVMRARRGAATGREALLRAVFAGEAIAGSPSVAPGHPRHARAHPLPARDPPCIWPWHRRNTWGMTDRPHGSVACPDGMFRHPGLRLN